MHCNSLWTLNSSFSSQFTYLIIFMFLCINPFNGTAFCYIFHFLLYVFRANSIYWHSLLLLPLIFFCSVHLQVASWVFLMARMGIGSWINFMQQSVHLFTFYRSLRRVEVIFFMYAYQLFGTFDLFFLHVLYYLHVCVLILQQDCILLYLINFFICSLS